MKITVQRTLNAGIYNVSFGVGNFTSEEVLKMSSFGTPAIQLFNGPPGARGIVKVLLPQIAVGYKAGFTTEQEARDYENRVLAEIKAAMLALRTVKDSFSSKDEVEI